TRRTSQKGGGELDLLARSDSAQEILDDTRRLSLQIRSTNHLARRIDKFVPTKCNRYIRIFQATVQGVIESLIHQVILMEDVDRFAARSLDARVPVTCEAEIVWLPE